MGMMQPAPRPSVTRQHTRSSSTTLQSNSATPSRGGDLVRTVIFKTGLLGAVAWLGAVFFSPETVGERAFPDLNTIVGGGGGSGLPPGLAPPLHLGEISAWSWALFIVWAVYFLGLIVFFPRRPSWWEHRRFSTLVKPNPLIVLTGLWAANYVPTEIFVRVFDSPRMRWGFTAAIAGVLYLAFYRTFVPVEVEVVERKENVPPAQLFASPKIRSVMFWLAMISTLVPAAMMAALVPSATVLLPRDGDLWRAVQPPSSKYRERIRPTRIAQDCDISYDDDARRAFTEARQKELRETYRGLGVNVDAILAQDLETIDLRRRCIRESQRVRTSSP